MSDVQCFVFNQVSLNLVCLVSVERWAVQDGSISLIFLSFWTNSTFVRLGQGSGIIPMLFGTPWEFISAPGPRISECVMDGLCCKAIHYVYSRPGPRWAVLPGWTEFRPMGCRDGFSIVFETGWELFHVASEYENCIELSVQHAASHPKESWLQKICLFHPFSSLFILFYAWFVANLSLGPSLHQERPLLRSCGWSFASLQLPFHSDTLVSVSRCRKSPIMLHRVMFLLLGRMAP